MAAMAAAFGVAAGAEPYDVTPLHEAAGWRVDHVYDAGAGAGWCSAEVANAAEQWLSLVGYDDGALILFVGDPTWRLAPREAAFAVALDGLPWRVEGSTVESAFTAHLTTDPAGTAFLAELSEAGAAEVTGPEGAPLAAFDLRGAEAALAALGECWMRIAPAAPEPGVPPRRSAGATQA